MSKKDNLNKGRIGEGIGIEYLKSKKLKILDVNFRCKIGEIDIIARNRDTVIFIEVKTRRDNEYGYPSESVTYRKQKKISKVALYYLQKNKLFEYNVRFDVLEIWDYPKGMELNHILNAFEIIMN
ncbi:YraN family protein [Alkalibaculum sp. M08DMB]|uniref:UPF0102 protein GC105_09720 n=1 Tax=Alkalibaculum sporogenes TaxID=2655001 RepID=A0A6A7K9B4_9FIRM|nr:YraN family protein [Alkalibaculum sporogenes]MPW26068.1 YraN family protein [Alkalibaculum sporogenes]